MSQVLELTKEGKISSGVWWTTQTSLMRATDSMTVWSYMFAWS